MSVFKTSYSVVLGNVGDPIKVDYVYDDLGYACSVSKELAKLGQTNRVIKMTEVALYQSVNGTKPETMPRADCMSRSAQPSCPCRACKVTEQPAPVLLHCKPGKACALRADDGWCNCVRTAQ